MRSRTTAPHASQNRETQPVRNIARRWALKSQLQFYQLIPDTLTGEKKEVSQLREFADQIYQSPELVGQKIDEIITSLGKDLFVEEKKRIEEQQKQEYSIMARDAFTKWRLPHRPIFQISWSSLICWWRL